MNGRGVTLGKSLVTTTPGPPNDLFIFIHFYCFSSFLRALSIFSIHSVKHKLYRTNSSLLPLDMSDQIQFHRSIILHPSGQSPNIDVDLTLNRHWTSKFRRRFDVEIFVRFSTLFDVENARWIVTHLWLPAPLPRWPLPTSMSDPVTVEDFWEVVCGIQSLNSVPPLTIDQRTNGINVYVTSNVGGRVLYSFRNGASPP